MLNGTGENTITPILKDEEGRSACSVMDKPHQYGIVTVVIRSVIAEESNPKDIPPQPTPSAELTNGESQQEPKQPEETVAPSSGEGVVESSTITVEELAPATANIANALVCAGTSNDEKSGNWWLIGFIIFSLS